MHGLHCGESRGEAARRSAARSPPSAARRRLVQTHTSALRTVFTQSGGKCTASERRLCPSATRCPPSRPARVASGGASQPAMAGSAPSYARLRPATPRPSRPVGADGRRHDESRPATGLAALAAAPPRLVGLTRVVPKKLSRPREVLPGHSVGGGGQGHKPSHEEGATRQGCDGGIWSVWHCTDSHSSLRYGRDSSQEFARLAGWTRRRIAPPWPPPRPPPRPRCGAA